MPPRTTAIPPTSSRVRVGFRATRDARPKPMRVRIHFWSYFQDLAGAAEAEVDVGEGATVAEVLEAAWRRWPDLGRLRGSTLVAVDVDYADPSRVLAPGEEVSLFPPVQGG